MKSDREFLDGIYEKASRYEEQVSVETKTQRIIFKPALVTGFSLAACLAIVLLVIPNNPEKNLSIKVEIDKAGDDMTQANQQPSTDNYKINLARSINEIVVSGEIQSIDASGRQITLNKLTWYQGQEINNDQTMIGLDVKNAEDIENRGDGNTGTMGEPQLDLNNDTEEDTEEDAEEDTDSEAEQLEAEQLEAEAKSIVVSFEEFDYISELKVGSKVLLYIVEERGTYHLMDENSVYKFLKTRGDYSVYEGFDGSTIDTGIFFNE